MPGGHTHSPCMLSRRRQRVTQPGSFEEMQSLLRSAENKRVEGLKLFMKHCSYSLYGQLTENE